MPGPIPFVYPGGGGVPGPIPFVYPGGGGVPGPIPFVYPGGGGVHGPIPFVYPGGGGVPGPIPFVYPGDADPVLTLPILSAIASDECSPSLFNSSPIKYPPLLVNSQIHIQYIVHFITHIYYLLCTRADSSRLTTLSIHTGAVSLYAKLPDSNKQYNLPLYEYICSNFCGSLSSCLGVSLL